MADDSGAAAQSRSPGGPGWEVIAAVKDLAGMSQVEDAARQRPWSSWRQGPRQAVAPHHQARLPGQGHEDQVPREDLFYLPIKESEITNFFLGVSLKDKILMIMSVQKQTGAGRKIQFKAFVAIRDYKGHVVLGVKCSKEVATASVGPSMLSIVPV